MMFGFPPPIWAFLVGIVSGLVTSIPGGPVNAAILNEGARRGFARTIFIGAGAVLMEAIYCTIASAGFGEIFGNPTIQAAMELGSFVLTLWLGMKYLLGSPMPGEERGIEMVEHRFHPHAGFWIGFSRVLGNPGILLLWIGVAASLLAHGWLQNHWASKGPFIAGVAVGGSIWFTFVGWGVSRGHGRFSSRTLQNMARASGVFLLIAAAILGGRIVLMLKVR